MSIKVLIAHDHPVLRYGLVAYLELQPDICVVAQADDGDQVLPETARAYPDVLANRLTSVDGEPYTWDNVFATGKPGNLLSISTTLRALHSEVTALNESRHPERSVLCEVKDLNLTNLRFFPAAKSAAFQNDEVFVIRSAGVYTYALNHANQLVSVSRAGTAVGYGYNGQGDRVSLAFS